jgi:hypothetical protein
MNSILHYCYWTRWRLCDDAFCLRAGGDYAKWFAGAGAADRLFLERNGNRLGSSDGGKNVRRGGKLRIDSRTNYIWVDDRRHYCWCRHRASTLSQTLGRVMVGRAGDVKSLSILPDRNG